MNLQEHRALHRYATDHMVKLVIEEEVSGDRLAELALLREEGLIRIENWGLKDGTMFVEFYTPDYCGSCDGQITETSDQGRHSDVDLGTGRVLSGEVQRVYDRPYNPLDDDSERRDV